MKKQYQILSLLMIITFFITPNCLGLDNTDVEVEITAGPNGKQFGYGIITINITNNNPDEILVYYNTTFDRIYSMEIPNFYFEQTTIAPNESKEIVLDIRERIGSSWYPIIIFEIDIDIEFDGVRIEKDGIAYRQFVWLFK